MNKRTANHDVQRQDGVDQQRGVFRNEDAGEPEAYNSTIPASRKSINSTTGGRRRLGGFWRISWRRALNGCRR